MLLVCMTKTIMHLQPQLPEILLEKKSMILIPIDFLYVIMEILESVGSFWSLSLFLWYVLLWLLLFILLLRRKESIQETFHWVNVVDLTISKSCQLHRFYPDKLLIYIIVYLRASGTIKWTRNCSCHYGKSARTNKRSIIKTYYHFISSIVSPSSSPSSTIVMPKRI